MEERICEWCGLKTSWIFMLVDGTWVCEPCHDGDEIGEPEV
jgi:hypothetical protein